RYHINIFAAAWQVLQAAIQTAGIPGSTFEPEAPKDPNDVETARIAKLISDYQHKAIDFRALWMGVFRFFFTDGLCLAYEHHVRDASAYGTTQTIVQKRVEIPVPAGWGCQNCATFTMDGQHEQDEEGNSLCPQCGSQYPDSAFMGQDKRVEIVPEMQTIAA